MEERGGTTAVFMMLVKTCEISPGWHVSSLFICLSDLWAANEILQQGPGTGPCQGARAARWFTHSSCCWLRHPTPLHYISSWTLGPIRKIKIIKAPAVVPLLRGFIENYVDHGRKCPHQSMITLSSWTAPLKTVHKAWLFPQWLHLLKESLAPACKCNYPKWLR